MGLASDTDTVYDDDEDGEIANVLRNTAQPYFMVWPPFLNDFQVVRKLILIHTAQTLHAAIV